MLRVQTCCFFKCGFVLQASRYAQDEEDVHTINKEQHWVFEAHYAEKHPQEVYLLKLQRVLKFIFL